MIDNILMPHSESMEKVLLASFIYSPETLTESGYKINPDYFYHFGRKRIFEWMIKNNSSDLTILYAAFPDISDVIDSIDNCYSKTDVDPVLSVLKEKYNQRKIIELTYKAMIEAQNGQIESDTICEDLQSKISDIQNIGNESFPQHICDLIEPVIIQCAAALDNNRAIGLSTGLIDVDAQLGGLVDGEFIILAARPSMGKSSMASNIIRHNAIKNKIPTTIFTLEMSKTLTTGRLLFSEAEQNYDSVLRGVANKTVLNAVQLKTPDIINSPIIIDDTGGIGLAEIMAKCQVIKQRWGLRLLIVDHIGLIGNSGKGKSRNDEISQISAFMKKIAIKFNIPVIGLCQLNRDVEKRVPPFPMLSDLRDSGSLEQDADKVIMLYREDYYFPKGQEVKDKKTKITTYSGPTGICDVIIAKNKNGRTGTIKTIFDENTMNFKSISEQTEDYSSFLKE